MPQKRSANAMPKKAVEKSPKLFVEEVTERYGEAIIASTVRPATDEEITECKARHAEGECPHTVIYDIDCWPYYERLCGVCGAHRGFI